MERFKIVKIQEHKDYISVYINDSKEDISFWVEFVQNVINELKGVK